MTETPSNQVIVTLADLKRWEDEARDLDAQISALVVRKDGLNRRLEAAKLLISEVTRHQPEKKAADPVAPPKVRNPRVLRKITVSKRKVPTVGEQWQDQILSVVRRYAKGCTYAELRSDLGASPLGERLSESSKSYERAMAKLGQAGKIERGWGRVFTPEAFAAYRAEIEAGTVSPVNSQAMKHSPMGEAILRIVYDSPGAKSRQIINELRKDAEFDATLTPHESGAFNVIARLTKRQQIVKGDDGGCFPGVAFPYDLLGLQPKGERAPSSDAAGALSAGEVAASPNDSQPTLRLIS